MNLHWRDGIVKYEILEFRPLMKRFDIIVQRDVGKNHVESLSSQKLARTLY